MSLTVTDTLMTSDHTPHRAVRVGSYDTTWVVSWLPERRLDRNQAVTAMTFAENAHDPWAEHLLPDWAAELNVDLDCAIREAKKGAAPCATPTRAGEPADAVCTPGHVGGSDAHATSQVPEGLNVHNDPHLMSGTCVCGCDECMQGGICVCTDCTNRLHDEDGE